MPISIFNTVLWVPVWKYARTEEAGQFSLMPMGIGKVGPLEAGCNS